LTGWWSLVSLLPGFETDSQSQISLILWVIPSIPMIDILIAALIALSAAAPSPTRPVAVKREAYLMGTLLRASVEAPDRPAGLAALERAFAEVRRLEDLLSTWRPDTELARLNATPVGAPFAASTELVGLLQEARRWRDATEGAFDPGLGALIDAWDMRGPGRRPSPAELASARGATGLVLFEVDPSSGTVRRTRAGAWIDSGAFGKGAALRGARVVLEDAGVRSALLDFGGQVLAIGLSAGESGWSVAVAHPARRSQPAAVIRIADASASTSGQSERGVELEGCRVGHILDPRRGLPVPAWGSVTVVAADPLVADALSTGLFVLGPERALDWARDRSDVGVLVLAQKPDGLRAGWSGSLTADDVELAPDVVPLVASGDLPTLWPAPSAVEDCLQPAGLPPAGHPAPRPESSQAAEME
jgi:thiamine biosynthesis lipoprotein